MLVAPPMCESRLTSYGNEYHRWTTDAELLPNIPHLTM